MNGPRSFGYNHGVNFGLGYGHVHPSPREANRQLKATRVAQHFIGHTFVGDPIADNSKQSHCIDDALNIPPGVSIPAVGVRFLVKNPESKEVVALNSCPVGLESVWGSFLWRELNEYLRPPPLAAFTLTQSGRVVHWTPNMGCDIHRPDNTCMMVEPHGVSFADLDDIAMETNTPRFRKPAMITANKTRMIACCVVYRMTRLPGGTTPLFDQTESVPTDNFNVMRILCRMGSRRFID